MATGARGQSEVLGTALLLGITVLSIALVVSIAGTALDSTRDTTDIESAEHAMSQLDSRGALVALGRTESQSISMGRARSGSYYVDEDAGRITITHKDYNITNGDEVLYNETLGALVYEHGDTTVAYQGGGVWRSDGGGGSTLVSPPEFHYRGETLTIPIIRVRSPNGGGGASGSVTAHLERNRSADPIYPSAETYPGGGAYANPIQNGTIQVTVQSEYYQAWGSFFRSRTEGNVTVYESNQTAVVELVVPAVEGEFRMPLDGDSIRLRGVGGKHAVTDLNLTLAPDDSDSANFANLKWSLYAEDGSEKLELHIRSGDDMKCDSLNDTDGAADGSIYYTAGGGTYQGWNAENVFPVTCNDHNGDGDPEARVIANWSKPVDFNYSTLSSSDLHYFTPSGSLQEPVKFDEHSADDPGDQNVHNYTVGESENVNFTVSHYAAFFGPTLEFTVSDSGGGGGTVNEDVSTGRVHYGGAKGSFVTYIHATENSVNVTLTS